jgi:hypothetical protein
MKLQFSLLPITLVLLARMAAAHPPEPGDLKVTASFDFVGAHRRQVKSCIHHSEGFTSLLALTAAARTQHLAPDACFTKEMV